MIRDIAAQAGVSIATVSRVLNGRPDVSPSTRDLVLEQVRAMGYVGNRSARGLVSGRTGLISVVVPFTQNGFFSAIIEGASEALFERDARPVLCPTQHRHDRELSVLERLVHGTTDGTLLVTPTETRAELQHLRQFGSPFVIIDPGLLVQDGVPVVSSTNWAGGRQATEHLISLGHRRIGVVTGYPGWCATVVSAGVVKDARSMSSKPTTDRSSGSCRPRSRAARMTPRARLSLCANTAVGGEGSESKAWPAAWPPSYLKSDSTTYSGRNGSPAPTMADW